MLSNLLFISTFNLSKVGSLPPANKCRIDLRISWIESDTSDLGATLLLHAIPLLVTEFPVIESAVIEILSVSPFMRIK